MSRLILFLYSLSIRFFWTIVQIKMFFFKSSPQRALAWLKKHPGPYISSTGRRRYVWILNIYPDEPDVVGTAFDFVVRDVPPPPWHKIGTVYTLDTHCHATEPRQVDHEPESTFGYSFEPFYSTGQLLEQFRDFIQTDTDRDYPTLKVSEKPEGDEPWDGPKN